MQHKFMVRTDRGLSKPIPRAEAIEMVKDYSSQGVEAYIVSEDEGKRIEKNNNQFNTPKWN
ncbi:hypothetical protein [Alkaliphilus metalliredigens]|uniref:hypothetical protein n=1 Tax=Alkaliphilus metalliredigens TaxID=208226 RepID=UPI000674CC5B|nr:hypothetical protein [Alkaliphilus metalliredigens]